MPPKFYLRTDGCAYRAIAVLCVCLLFLTGFTAAVHFHADNATAGDHPCSICAHVHAGIAQVEIRSAVPVLASSVVPELPADRLHSLLLVTFHYIRPPPIA